MNPSAIRTSLIMLLLSVTVLFGAMGLAFLIMPDRTDVTYRVPPLFYLNTLVLIASSVLMHTAWLRRTSRNPRWLLLTILAGLAFFVLQAIAWYQLYAGGLSPRYSGPKVSFLYLLSLLHCLHIAAATILATVVMRNKASGVHRLFEPAMVFWHFLGILWIYLLVVLSLG